MVFLRFLLVTLLASFFLICRISGAPAWKQSHDPRKTIKQQRNLKDSIDSGKHYADKSELYVKPMMISVKPRVVEPNKYQSATVVCSATSGNRIEDLPFLAFYWQFHDDALVPITSSIPGVHIEPLDDEPGVYGQRLTITYPLYSILESGKNRFLCVASNMSGQRVQAEFVVKTN